MMSTIKDYKVKYPYSIVSTIKLSTSGSVTTAYTWQQNQYKKYHPVLFYGLEAKINVP